MRLIDADDLKTWFGEKDLYTYDYIISTIDDAPTVKPEPHWISCDERLPEEGCEVLLQWKVINTDDNRFFAITHRSDYNYWTGIGREIIPVAWMPLPPAYKGGE